MELDGIILSEITKRRQISDDLIHTCYINTALNVMSNENNSLNLDACWEEF